MTRCDISRRRFLQSVEALGAGALILGSGLETLAGFAANDTIEIGCIGTGGRCRRLMEVIKAVPNVRLSAICDVNDASIQLAREIAHPEAFVTKNYAEVLGRKDLDAVIIGSPDHWHVPMTIDACRAGKDVYVEKPLTHHLEEGASVIEAHKASKSVVQVGMQQRSMPQIIKARELFKAGRIGDVHKVHLTWNRNVDRVRRQPPNIDPKTVDWKSFLGNAPDQPFDEYKLRNWRWFWDFGGGILTDLMVHLIDVAQWFLDVEHPLRATAIGDNYLSAGLWQTPDTVHCLLDYPDQRFQSYFEGTFFNARNRAMIEFMGTKGTLYVDRGRYEIHPEREADAYEEWSPGKEKRRGLDYYDEPNGELLHLINWLDCIRSRKEPNCPVEAGVAAANAAHLGNLALRSNQVATCGEQHPQPN
jgi:predicted dehydrogenase